MKTLFINILKDAAKSVDTVMLKDFIKRYPEQQDAAKRAYERAQTAEAMKQVVPAAYYMRFSKR